MDTLVIEKKDEVYLTIDCDPNVQREISEFFTFYVPGYKFMPAFRNRMWDGKIRLFSQKYKEIYFGLFPYIKAFAEERGYNIVCGEDVEIDNTVDKNIVEVQLIDEAVFRSNYNQMFLLGRYRKDLFEETFNACPFSRLYKVKF